MPMPREQVDIEQSHQELHDLCQPLTALQCRLEMGRMLGHPEALEEALKGALEETRRMFHVIAAMRRRLQEIEEAVTSVARRRMSNVPTEVTWHRQISHGIEAFY